MFSPHLRFVLVSGDNHHWYKLQVEKCGQKESHLNFSCYQKYTCNPVQVDSHLGVSLIKAFVKLTRLWHFVAEADILRVFSGASCSVWSKLCLD